MPVVVVLLAGASVDTAQLKEKKGFKQQFDVGKKLGEGTYGTVWLVKDKVCWIAYVSAATKYAGPYANF
jgi:serine/threonine protein kinase